MLVDRQIRGFTFAFLLYSPYLSGGEGVIVPYDADLNDTEYVTALRAAMSVWQHVHADVILAGGSIQHNDVSRLSTEECERYVEALTLLRDQNEFKPADEAIAFGEAVTSVWEKRREKAEERELKARRRSVQTGGYIYVVQSPTGLYKIGRTKTPEDRLKTFEVKLPFEIEYVCVIQTRDMYSLERDLHTRFADKRIGGEWFALDASDVDYIKSLGGES